MKLFFALMTTLMMGSALAETMPLAEPGRRHMIEFNTESLTSAVFAFDNSKVKGSETDNSTRANLTLNYAYGFHPLLQAGVRFNYSNTTAKSIDQEQLDLSLGIIANHQADFARSMFAALYLGAGYSQIYGAGHSRDDIRHGTLSVGKRFPLEMFGIKHVTYTPEVAVRVANSTTGESFDYSQSLELRFLQFSVFF